MDQGAGRQRRRRSRPFYQGLIGELLDHARGNFLLDERQKDGSTLRAILESVERQTRIRPKQLDVPECPPEVEYILGWFYELHAERGTGALGDPEALSSEKLESWSRLNRITPSAFELEAIRRLDRLLLSKKYDEQEE